MFNIKNAGLVGETFIDIPTKRRVPAAVTVDQDGMIQISFVDESFAMEIFRTAIQNDLVGFDLGYIRKDGDGSKV